MTIQRLTSTRFQLTAILALLVVGAIAAISNGLVVQGAETDQGALATVDNIAAGRVIYESSCAYCHGLKGDGDGPVTPFLDVKPRDLTTGIYKFRSTANGQIPTDWDLMRSLTEGIHGTSMVGWAALDVNKRWQVIHYMKTFSERFINDKEVEIISIDSPPEVTLESIKRGKQVYLDAECWKCHGYGGKGDGPSASSLKDNFGYPIVPRDLTERDNFGRGYTPGEIYLTLVTGINGTPMPSYRDAFEGNEDMLWDLVHYVNFLTGSK